MASVSVKLSIIVPVYNVENINDFASNGKFRNDTAVDFDFRLRQELADRCAGSHDAIAWGYGDALLKAGNAIKAHARNIIAEHEGRR